MTAPKGAPVEVLTLDGVGHGRALELWEAALVAIAADIADPEKDPEGRRRFQLVVDFKPTTDGLLEILVSSDVKLAKVVPTLTLGGLAGGKFHQYTLGLEEGPDPPAMLRAAILERHGSQK